MIKYEKVFNKKQITLLMKMVKESLNEMHYLQEVGALDSKGSEQKMQDYEELIAILNEEE